MAGVADAVRRPHFTGDAEAAAADGRGVIAAAGALGDAHAAGAESDVAAGLQVGGRTAIVADEEGGRSGLCTVPPPMTTLPLLPAPLPAVMLLLVVTMPVVLMLSEPVLPLTVETLTGPLKATLAEPVMPMLPMVAALVATLVAPFTVSVPAVALSAALPTRATLAGPAMVVVP